VTAYKSLLSAIKAEYEECIDTIRRGQNEAQYLNGKLSEMVNEPGTLQHNRRRADELKYKYVKYKLSCCTTCRVSIL